MINIKIKILDEGKHYIVLFKPPGILVMPHGNSKESTLLGMARKQLGRNILPTHRLDRVTTGCCLFAKTPYGQQALFDLFKKHLINKIYLAIVEGIPSFQTKTVNSKLVKILNLKKNYSYQTISSNHVGEKSLTNFKVLSIKNDFSLIEAQPITGKMHQIRIHLSHIGLPIVGDQLYGSSIKYFKQTIALHAYRIIFPLPEGGGYKNIIATPNERFTSLAKKHSLRQLKNK